MINIDTVPIDDEQELNEKPILQNDDADEDFVENPEELLERLAREKEEWKAQLAAMKATLEAQDKMIEEDRTKCQEILEEEENKAQLVPISKAPTRKVNRTHANNRQPVQAKLAAVTDRVRTVWAGSQETMNRRARSMAKSLPFAGGIGDLYLQTYGCTPSRYMNNSGYPGAFTNQPIRVDDLGRIVRQAKVLSVADASGAILPVARSPAMLPSAQSSVAIPTIRAGGPVRWSGTTSASTVGFPGVALSGGSVVSSPSVSVVGSISGMRAPQFVMPTAAQAPSLAPAAAYNVLGSNPRIQYRRA